MTKYTDNSAFATEFAREVAEKTCCAGKSSYRSLKNVPSLSDRQFCRKCNYDSLDNQLIIWHFRILKIWTHCFALLCYCFPFPFLSFSLSLSLSLSWRINILLSVNVLSTFPPFIVWSYGRRKILDIKIEDDHQQKEGRINKALLQTQYCLASSKLSLIKPSGWTCFIHARRTNEYPLQSRGITSVDEPALLSETQEEGDEK